ncbi:MAG TPA: outer membrane lipoprotein chaperone LolA [Terriglobales bacterium]|jgi:outer membrane lipoprotein carrier protein|nr:outer membrane lipoprotein chaperone LolA [Terriglobales bacterium]HET7873460.1 outer membrane lipoprotein chaperone LolA [Terriglobales bacterium]
MRSLSYLLLGLLLSAVATAQNDAHKIAESVDRRYNNMHSLEAQFTETYRGAGMARNESGTLWLKRPGKMRWDYREPRPKLFISDGKTAWFYVPGDQQVRKASVKKLDDLRSPIRYLLGKTKLEKEFSGLSLAPDAKPLDAGDVVLRGLPKGMEDRVTQVLLEITPDSEIRSITIDEADGSTTQFRLFNQKQNIALLDSRFRFVPPPGVETVEATEVSQ